MTVSPEIFQFFYILIFLVLILKALISIFLARKVIIKKRKIGKLEFDFLFAVLIVFICLFLSRLLYFYFDFYLTKLDSNLYYIYPNVVYWIIASLFLSAGFVVLVYVVDKHAANCNFRGIPSLSLIILSLLILV